MCQMEMSKLEKSAKQKHGSEIGNKVASLWEVGRIFFSLDASPTLIIFHTHDVKMIKWFG